MPRSYWHKNKLHGLIYPNADPSKRGNSDWIQKVASIGWGQNRTTTERISVTINRIKEWDMHMARKTYRIELKIDFDDTKAHEVLVEIAKQYTRDFLASAALLQDGRKPAAVLMVDDHFYGVEEIDIMKESRLLHEVTESK